MNVEEEAVGRLVRRLEALGIPYMVAGSVASSHHGRPRATNDADVVIDPTSDALEALVAGLRADGYYVDPQIALALSARRLFNVIDPESAFKVDLIIRKDRPFAGGSERQLADALGVLQVSGDRIDRAYVARWAAALGVEDLRQEILRQLAS